MIREWAKDVYWLSRRHLLLGLQGRRDAKASTGPDYVTDGSKYFLPADYRSRSHVEFDDHEAVRRSGVVWQPDVYELARLIAGVAGVGYVMDVGCGHGEKLAKLHPHCEVIGVDTADNIEWCKRHYDFGQWLAIDLDVDFPELPAAARGNAVLICSDVIEHIFDLDRFLKSIAAGMAQCVAGVISTPDRSLIYPGGQLGPPVNRCHSREWTPPEFKKLLESAGLETWVGLTRTNTRTDDMETIIAIVSGKARR
jgi:SAM-dependent methyltransferase